MINGNEYITYKVIDTTGQSSGSRRKHYTVRELPAEEIDKLKATTLYKVLEYVKKIHLRIYNHLINVKEGENIPDRARQPRCWEELVAKLRMVGNEAVLPSDLLSASGSSEEELTEGQLKALSSASEVTADTWSSICNWSKANPNKLTPREYVFISHIAYMTKRSKPLSYKQSRWALDIKENVESMGWTLN